MHVCVCDGVPRLGVCVYARVCMCDGIAGIPEIFLCKGKKTEKVQYPDLGRQLILYLLIK